LYYREFEEVGFWSVEIVCCVLSLFFRYYSKKNTIYEILQILNVSVFDKIPINQLLTNTSLRKKQDVNHN
ncbi:MAG: hypothetical protein ACPGTO_03415, partial [Polaribacter sp.]